MPRIELWSINWYGTPYTAPEALAYRVEGLIYDDDRSEDGKLVTTSSILELNLEENYVQTRNTRYILGVISPMYKQFLENNNKELKSFKVE